MTLNGTSTVERVEDERHSEVLLRSCFNKVSYTICRLYRTPGVHVEHSNTHNDMTVIGKNPVRTMDTSTERDVCPRIDPVRVRPATTGLIF